jgi:hypothetical protein
MFMPGEWTLDLNHHDIVSIELGYRSGLVMLREVDNFSSRLIAFIHQLESHPFNARNDQRKREDLISLQRSATFDPTGTSSSKSPVHLFMDSLKAQSLLKADPSGFSRSHKTEITYEENPLFILLPL